MCCAPILRTAPQMSPILARTLPNSNGSSSRPTAKFSTQLIRVITVHLKEAADPLGMRLNLHFNGVIFDGGDFRDAESPAALPFSTTPSFQAARSASTAPSFPGGASLR